MQPLQTDSKVNKTTTALILILLLALIVRLGLVLAVPTQPISDFKEFDRLASGLLTGRGYVNENGQPTAYRPPGYIFFITGIYAIFGHHDIAIRLVNILLGMLACWLTYYLANELFNRRTALLAACLMAVFPSLVAWTNILANENLFIPLTLGILITFIKAVKTIAIRWPWLAGCGVLTGLAVLTRPASLLLPISMVIGMILVEWRAVSSSGLKWLAKPVAIAVVLYALVFVTILPWTIRNQMVFGRFVLVSTEGGITFLSGHNIGALHAEYSLDGPVFDQLNAEKLDEVSYDSRAYQLAFQFIQKNPGIELRLLAYKMFNFFKDDVSGITYNDLSAIHPLPNWLIGASKGIAEIFYLVILVSAIIAFFLKRFPGERWYILLPVFILMWTVFHLAFYGKDRFRLPLTPELVILAAVTILATWDERSNWLSRFNAKPVK
jgi:4-amino-4-deoxy-L-arabinose transferase-like glycosyltransferase